MFRIVPSLLEVVGRVVIVSIPSYEKLSHFLVGFDVFTAKFQISQIHLIGFGLGGFLSLHISTYPNLSAEIKSLTLVSSYVSTVDFRNAGFLKFFTGKTRIFKDLSLDSAPDHLVNSYAFIAKEIEIIPASLISSRLTLRATSPNISISKIPQNPILIIQTLDFPLNISNSALPQQALGSMASVCLLKIGGCFPHLADPENLISCIKRHLQKIVGEK
ncbi:maspardin [Histomonas meleagridis]|uniref:maspardin n=1 Tax=Histomonas meleagridis TaxID=135588 RepID=UPI00355A2F97|nr:maspardin [Histomonas meleagridis]KAH0802391.1 maspardin [Histomonas meleagridis]